MQIELHEKQEHNIYHRVLLDFGKPYPKILSFPVSQVWVQFPKIKVLAGYFYVKFFKMLKI